MQEETNKFNSQFNILLENNRYKFYDWDSVKKDIPMSISGVYLIWFKEKFLWAGMASVSGQTSQSSNSKDETHTKEEGLRRRLNSHALGNRGGDYFCVRVCDCFIYPELTKHDKEQLKKGKNILDGEKGKVRKFVRCYLEFQYLETQDKETAIQLETALRRGECHEFGQPLLNPK